MRIAVLSSNFIRLPPEADYVPKGSSGAPERVMSVITEELVRRGHEVTLFASGDSLTSAKLISVWPKSSSMDPMIGEKDHQEMEHLLISLCYKMAKEGKFDVIHSLFDTRSAYYAGLVNIPTVSTLHSELSGIKKIILEKIPDTQYYVSISNNQRKSIPGLRYISTIYHGLEISNFSYSETGGDEMLIAGRIDPCKGIKEAIAISKRTGRGLNIAGDYTVKNESYWKNEIEPNIDGQKIKHFGFIDNIKLLDLYKNARIFILPLQWEEPFGLVMIEAMACGTPVVAFNRGSVSEVVRDGITGFIVNPDEVQSQNEFIIKKTGIPGLCEAVERIYAMPEAGYRQMRVNCQKHVEANFTVGKMVDGYEEVYERVTHSASSGQEGER